MYETEKSVILKKAKLHASLIPIKLYFFFSFGAFGASIPFLPVLAKDLNITATAVGFVYTVLSFTVLFSKPIFGSIADHFGNLKVVMISITVTSLGSGFAISYIPPIIQERTGVNISSITSCEEALIFADTSNFNFTCLDILIQEYIPNCNASYKICPSSQNNTQFLDICNNTSINSTTLFILDLLDIGINRGGIPNGSCSCDTLIQFFTKPDVCFLKNRRVGDIHIYKTFQFWTYAVLSIIFGVCTSSLFSLSDAACYEVLGDEPRLYGKQRLWGTIGYGSASLFAGYLNDAIPNASQTTNYVPGFYLMGSLFIVDLIILYFSKLKETTNSSSICKDVSKMFTSFEIVVFAVSVFIMGSLTAVIWQYQFWFLTDLGAGHLLLGLTVGVQCLVAEGPSFFASGKIIDMFGHTYCLVGSFLAFAIRFALYFCLTNPWWVLPIEILHGQTYGVFYAAMTSFANSKAPPGTEATMIGILCGLFEGLGVATGSFLGGIGFDTLKGRCTFLTASIVSAVCGTFLCFIHSIYKLKRKT